MLHLNHASDFLLVTLKSFLRLVIDTDRILGVRTHKNVQVSSKIKVLDQMILILAWNSITSGISVSSHCPFSLPNNLEIASMASDRGDP